MLNHIISTCFTIAPHCTDTHPQLEVSGKEKGKFSIFCLFPLGFEEPQHVLLQHDFLEHLH